jgi:hypothetical protein
MRRPRLRRLKACLRRLVVLSDRERRVLDDLERNYDAEAAGPPPRPGPRPRNGEQLRTVVALAVAGWISLLLLVVGAVTGALAIAVATGLGWCLWHYWTALKRGSGVAGRYRGRTGGSE